MQTASVLNRNLRFFQLFQTWTDPTTNVTTLFCQHGRSECELNALHACIVEHNDVNEQMKLISCLLTGHATSLDEASISISQNIITYLNISTYF